MAKKDSLEKQITELNDTFISYHLAEREEDRGFYNMYAQLIIEDNKTLRDYWDRLIEWKQQQKEV